MMKKFIVGQLFTAGTAFAVYSMYMMHPGPFVGALITWTLASMVQSEMR